MMKSFIQKLSVQLLIVMFLTTAFTTSLVSPLFAIDDFHIENQPQVIEKVLELPQKGILKQKENGYLYVEVSRDYIAETLPLLDVPGKIDPPSHYKSKKGIGAHISVMYEDERIENEIWEIDELGQEFTFTVMELRTVKLNKDGQMKKLWLIAVDAPELEFLRESYGLSSRLKNHNFHITLGTQVPGLAKLNVNQVQFDEFEVLDEYDDIKEAA